MDLLVPNIQAEIRESFQQTVPAETDCESDQKPYDSATFPLREKSVALTKNWVIESSSSSSSQTNRVRVALGIVVRIVLPIFHGVSRSFRGIRAIRLLEVLRNVRYSRQLLANLVAYAANSISLNLSTVQVHKFDPLLKMMKLRRAPPAKALEQDTNSNNNNNCDIRVPSPMRLATDPPERCVTLNVLAEPVAGTPIRADVIFIHGLHGSLINTWKQGVWNSEGRRVDIERPPRPPVRPPKRQRHSRTTLFDPPHSSKRPKITRPDPLENDLSDSSSSAFSYDSFYSTLDEMCSMEYSSECEDSEGTVMDEGASRTDVNSNEVMEHQLPAFRLREEDEEVDEVDEENERTSAFAGLKTEDYSRCWPGDWLPVDCPGVRVIAVNYTTDPYLWRPLWVRKRNRTTLLERAREMMELLTEIGVGVGHPIVWVGHSKGGIFIKQIMVDAWESGLASVEPLWRSSRGCFFYSVPHRGSPLADFNLPLVRQSVELVEIKKNSPGVLDLHRRFVALYRCGHLKVQIFSFVETALTLMSVLYLRIVGIDSADPGIGEVYGVHLDHREICKPRDRDCILYTKLTKMINRVR